MMVSYYEGFIAKEIAKALAKRGKTKKTGGKDGDLKKDREPRATYRTPPKSERIKRSRERQKEKEKQEREKEQGPIEHRVSISASRRHAKKREKVIVEGGLRPSAWTFKGTITEVGMNYVKVGSYPGKIFQVEEITKIIKGAQQISLDDLKEGMDATVRYTMKGGNMVAKWIKVTG